MKTLAPDEVENAPASPQPKPSLGTVHYIANGESFDIPREKAARFERENPDAKKAPAPVKGNGQPITRQVAAQYLLNAGGDLDKARSTAKKDGWLVADGDSASPVTVKPGEPQAVNSNGDRAVIRNGKWVDVRSGLPIGPEGEHFAPQSHVFSKNAFRKANPAGNLTRIAALAEASGYKIVE